MKYKVFLLMGLTAVAVGCSSIDCPVENTVAVHYLVCNSDGTEQALTDSLSVDSKNVHGTQIVLNRLSGSATFSLPISYNHPEDVLTFTFFNDSVSRTDTVWIKKNDIPHFESVDCSAAFFHELTDVRHTTHAIDSLVIKNRTVDYDTRTVHLHLYPKSSD